MIRKLLLAALLVTAIAFAPNPQQPKQLAAPASSASVTESLDSSKVANTTPQSDTAQKAEMVQPTAPSPAPVESKIEPKSESKIVEPEPVAVQQSPSAGRVNNIVPCETFRPKLAQYGWNVEVALKVIDAESYGGLDGKCNTLAKNPEVHRDAYGNVICNGSYGLFQISCHGGEVYDVDQNIAAAWAKYQARKWQPWGVCLRGIVSCY